jgi:hypothetical protein
MAKSKSMFEGKNAVQDAGHIRSIKHPNGNQGFSSNKLGGDTVPGPNVGAPLSSKKEQLVTRRHIDPSGENPYNHIEGNAPGVLGAHVARQDAGHYPDSPVPGHAEKPDLAIRSKAGEAAHEDSHIGLHPEGVLGRG